MFKKTKVFSAVLAVLGTNALLMSTTAYAQEELQRVEITGSSIKRINAENSVPVTVITADQIAKTGLTTVTDVIQSLPSMQGFLTTSQSINGGGGGATNASLHSIGSNYTLVLLNGRRLAPYNTGTTVNLNAIPLGAIERIEVLTDGASAVYGADAIAGVVNFVLKKDTTDGEVALLLNQPQHPGGKSKSFQISKGFGNVDTDRFNILLAASYDKQDALFAKQRPFSKSGIFDYDENGVTKTFRSLSSNSVPGNVFLNGPDPTDPDHAVTTLAFYSPYLLKTGTCPVDHVKNGQTCRFDFPSTVETIPESERTSLFGSGRLKVTENFSLFTEIALSKFVNKSIYAAPAQPGIYLTQALFDKHVTPYLGADGPLGLTAADIVGVEDPNDPNRSFNGPTMNVRVYDAGGRADEYRTDTLHYVLGGDGSFGAWDYSAYVTHSVSKFTDRAIGGYLSANAFQGLIDSGAYDPLDNVAGTSGAALAPAVLHQVLDESRSVLDMVSGKVQRPLFKLSGGDAQIAVGFEYGRQKYKDSPSAILQGTNALQPNFDDTIIGGGGGALPFDSKRNTHSFFSEIVAPVTKELELGAAVRYDSVSAVSNSFNFLTDGTLGDPATQGKSASSTTFKLSARYQPTKEVLLRASYGTGFKAPTLNNITSPLVSAGVTGFQLCPPGLPANLKAFCKPGLTEYNQLAGGNPFSDSTGLEPEKSKQYSFGFRIEPNDSISFGVDYWNVKLRNRIDSVPEDVAFSDGATYANLFRIANDPITGQPQLTFISSPSNLGRARYSGLDFDVLGRTTTPVGPLSGYVRATYMMKSEYEIPGLPGYQSSLGRVGPDTEVVFRWLASVGGTLETGDFANTVNVTYKPGYTDSGSPRTVSQYILVDAQTKYSFNKALSLTFGIKNLFDRDPPLTIADLAGTGNARGFDGRYTDPLGRQFYLRGSYKF